MNSCGNLRWTTRNVKTKMAMLMGAQCTGNARKNRKSNESASKVPLAKLIMDVTVAPNVGRQHVVCTRNRKSIVVPTASEARLDKQWLARKQMQYYPVYAMSTRDKK